MMVVLISFFLVSVLTITYFTYIFSNFSQLRLKKWLAYESFLWRLKSRLTIKYYMKKILFVLVKKECNNKRRLKFCYYHRLRWKTKPAISLVVFSNKRTKTYILTTSFR